MALETLTLPKKFYKYTECSKGDILAEGHFRRTGEDTFGNITYHIKEDDRMVVLNSSGHLNHQMMNEGIKPGDYIQVVYNGTMKLEKGKFKGKDCHQFILSQDFSRGIAASAPVSAAPSTPDTLTDADLEGMSL